eukprot:COSAG01_NODE_38_length_33931_cov_75.163632_31_plen_259_part_00
MLQGSSISGHLATDQLGLVPPGMDQRVRPTRLDIESPWLQTASEYQRFGHPPRLNHQPFWTQAAVADTSLPTTLAVFGCQVGPCAAPAAPPFFYGWAGLGVRVVCRAFSRPTAHDAPRPRTHHAHSAGRKPQQFIQWSLPLKSSRISYIQPVNACPDAGVHTELGVGPLPHSGGRRYHGDREGQVSQKGSLLRRRGRCFPVNASGVDTHRDSISSRLGCLSHPTLLDTVVASGLPDTISFCITSVASGLWLPRSSWID